MSVGAGRVSVRDGVGVVDMIALGQAVMSMVGYVNALSAPREGGRERERVRSAREGNERQLLQP